MLHGGRLVVSFWVTKKIEDERLEPENIPKRKRKNIDKNHQFVGCSREFSILIHHHAEQLRLFPWFSNCGFIAVCLAGSRHSLARAVPLSTRIGGNFLKDHPTQVVRITPICMYEKAIWKGSHNPMLRGLISHGYYPLTNWDDPWVGRNFGNDFSE